MNRTLMGIAAWTLGLSTVCAAQVALAPEEVTKLVADLGSPNLQAANEAIMTLGYEMEAKTGAEVRRQLEGALGSASAQQRHAAAQVLRDIPLPEISSKLIEVTVEGLRNDRLPGRPVQGSLLNVFNAAGYRWLIEHIDKARGPVVAALGSDDLQQRFLAAVCLGAVGDKERLGRVADILLPHLRDNQIQGDALLAASALYRLGPAIIPRLNEARAKADSQQKQIIELMLYDFNNPPTKPEDFGKRKGMQTVWQRMSDPVAFYPPEQLEIQWRGKMTEARRDSAGPVRVSTNEDVEDLVASWVPVTVTGVVEHRRNGVYLTGPGLAVWIAGEGVDERSKDGATLTVTGRFEESEPDERGVTEIVLMVRRK